MIKFRDLQDHGWKPLPDSLKAAFIFVSMGLLVSLLITTIVLSRSFGSEDFVYNLIGALATILLAGTFLIGLWKRYSWAGKYGLIYFVIVMFTGVFENYPEFNTIKIFFKITLSSIFMVEIYRKRSYFER